jgi:cytidine deaminase
MCAERIAVYRALGEGVQYFEAIAVAGPRGVRTMPCGACRQVLHEFGAGMQVIFDDDGSLRVVLLSALLPEPFSPGDLESAHPGPEPSGGVR